MVTGTFRAADPFTKNGGSQGSSGARIFENPYIRDTAEKIGPIRQPPSRFGKILDRKPWKMGTVEKCATLCPSYLEVNARNVSGFTLGYASEMFMHGCLCRKEDPVHLQVIVQFLRDVSCRVDVGSFLWLPG